MKKLFYLWVLAAMAVHSQAGYTNALLNITGCGGTMSSGRYTSIGSLVPVGGQTSQADALYHYSGFAAGFILQPKTACRGLSDEWAPDNDRDGLQDGEEIIVGSSLYSSDTDGDGLSDPAEVRTYGTSPLLADSDSDGINDSGELIAGTSPTNRASVLSMNLTLLPKGDKKISWFGIQGRNYTFQYRDSINTGEWQSYPFEVSGTDFAISFLDTAALPSRFYRVKVRLAE